MKRATKESKVMNYKLNSGKRLGDATSEDLISDAEIDRLIGEKLQEKAAILRAAADILGDRDFAEALKSETDPARKRTLMDGLRLHLEATEARN